MKKKEALTNEDLKNQMNFSDDFTLANIIISIVRWRIEKEDPVDLVKLFDEMKKNPQIVRQWQAEREDWYAARANRVTEKV